MPPRAQAMLRTVLILLVPVGLLAGAWWTVWTLLPLGIALVLFGFVWDQFAFARDLVLEGPVETACAAGFDFVERRMMAIGAVGAIAGLLFGMTFRELVGGERVLSMAVVGLILAVFLPVMGLLVLCGLSVGVRAVHASQLRACQSRDAASASAVPAPEAAVANGAEAVS